MQALNLKNTVSLLPQKTYLYFVDYNDSLNDSMEELQECLIKGNFDAIHEKIFEWFDSPNYEYYLNELKSDIESNFDVSIGEADEFIEYYHSELCCELDERDDSDVLKDLLRNTNNIRLRIDLICNCEGILPPHYTKAFSYDDGAKLIMDALQLNPADVKKYFLSQDVQVIGAFPNRSKRQPLVSCQDFFNEWRNCFSYSRLCIPILMDGQDFYDFVTSDKKVLTIPKNSQIGLFDSFNGSGSLFEMSLLKDWTFDLSKENANLVKNGFNKDFDYFDICIDSEIGYSINEVYGVTNDFYNKV
jgi:hypothetical protein